MDFSGVTTALVTPFSQGDVDQKSFLTLLESQVQQGVTKFVLNGTTGESPTLEESEVETLCLWFKKFQQQQKLNLKLILGTGTFSTRATLQKTKKAESFGADASLVVTPYYNKPSQEGLFEHFCLVAEATNLPLLLYNVPSRTSSSLSLETLQKLSVISNIIGVKEASGDKEFLKKIKEVCGKDFLCLSGDDFTAIESFFLGGDGVVSVASHVLGREFVSWFKRSLNQDKTVLDEFKKYLPFLKHLYQQTNPVGIKQILKQQNLISSAELRLPLKEPKEKDSLLQKIFCDLQKDTGS